MNQSYNSILFELVRRKNVSIDICSKIIEEVKIKESNNIFRNINKRSYYNYLVYKVLIKWKKLCIPIIIVDGLKYKWLTNCDSITKIKLIIKYNNKHVDWKVGNPKKTLVLSVEELVEIGVWGMYIKI